MQVIRSVKEMKTRSMDLRRDGKTIGFVPTMGFLHEGHLSLVDLIRKDCDILLLSIYVNPTQFGVGEDFDKYPRDTERDLELCRSRGVDLVFIPESSEIYAGNASTYVVEEEVGMGMCGNARPNHFRGVATVCAKLFNLCQPNYVVLGQKDAQQVVVLKRMIRDLHFPIQVLVGPILREADGLAMSSRNKYLAIQATRGSPTCLSINTGGPKSGRRKRLFQCGPGKSRGLECFETRPFTTGKLCGCSGPGNHASGKRDCSGSFPFSGCGLGGPGPLD